jgi:hypothetical protein
MTLDRALTVLYPFWLLLVDELVDGKVKGMPRSASAGKSTRKLILCPSPSEIGGELKAVRWAQFLRHSIL